MVENHASWPSLNDKNVGFSPPPNVGFSPPFLHYLNYFTHSSDIRQRQFEIVYEVRVKTPFISYLREIEGNAIMHSE